MNEIVNVNKYRLEKLLKNISMFVDCGGIDKDGSCPIPKSKQRCADFFNYCTYKQGLKKCKKTLLEWLINNGGDI